MQTVRLHDPSRRPAEWTGIIRAGQFAVFARHDTTGAACDADGQPFAAIDEATCVLFDSLNEARAFCEAAVQRHPSLRFDVFDADGRTRPPLLIVVHPDRAVLIETAPAQMRKRQLIAWSLIAAGLPLVVYAYVEFGDREREIILPAFLGLNMILVAGRLLWMNFALRETERVREERLAQALAGELRKT